MALSSLGDILLNFLRLLIFLFTYLTFLGVDGWRALLTTGHFLLTLMWNLFAMNVLTGLTHNSSTLPL